MGRPPDEAQNVLDQIEDVITNRYEDGYKYTAIELSGILDAIVAILDANRTADASEASPGQATQPDPGQRNARSQPVIMAAIYSDDRMKSTEFPANRWFAAASDGEIRELASIDWGYDLEADRIAYFMESLHRDLELVLDYCRELKRVSKEPVGFEVSVDKDQAMAWLALHRPTLWQELKSLHG